MKVNLNTTQERILQIIAEQEGIGTITSKHEIRNLVARRKDFKETYRQMIADGHIYETGTGKAGDPIKVHSGIKPRNVIAEVLVADPKTLLFFLADFIIAYPGPETISAEALAAHLKAALDAYRPDSRKADISRFTLTSVQAYNSEDGTKV